MRTTGGLRPTTSSGTCPSFVPPWWPEGRAVQPLQAVAVAGAGVVAGMINSVVGSGTLVTFPVLLAVGYPPLTANVSNGLGLVPGSLFGALGYRHELAGQGPRLRRVGVAAGGVQRRGAGVDRAVAGVGRCAALVGAPVGGSARRGHSHRRRRTAGQL